MFEAFASLSNAQWFVLQLKILQVACAVTSCAFLGERSTRTGWAQFFGLGTAAACATDPLFNAVLIYVGDPKLTTRIVSCVGLTLSFAGIVSLTTNTEDNQHPGIVDNIEISVIFLAFAAAVQCSRLALSIMDSILYSTHAYKRSLMTNTDDLGCGISL